MSDKLNQCQKKDKSIGFRLFVIVVLSLLLLIPSFMIMGLIFERQTRRASVVNDIAYKWSGGEQAIAGPILTIPFKKYFKDAKGVVRTTTSYAHFLPRNLSIKGSMTPEVRYRGIYKVVLYHSDLHFEGVFSKPDLDDLNISLENALLEDAFLQIGMSNVKGIKESIVIDWQGLKLPADSGVKSTDVVRSGANVNVALDASTKEYAFSFDIKLKGHDSLYFVPVGKDTGVEISSSWNDPSFTGSFLPSHRQITNSGFSAKWKIIDLNREFPQQWIANVHDIHSTSFGVRLFKSVDIYQKAMRTVKYAIMFIGLTFLVFFMIEVLNQNNIKRMHPIQYLLIGFGLILFYSLLLSLSEHIGFLPAYLLASGAVVILITAYSKSVLLKGSLIAMVGGLLCLLYGYLYIILQLEDYALLIGSIGLFVILALVMYLTRSIDWSHKGSADR